MGFKNEIEEILNFTASSERQTLLFSATLSSAIENIGKLALKNPLRVDISKGFQVANNLRQEVIKLKTIKSERVKESVLLELLIEEHDKRIVVFFPTKFLCHKFYHYCAFQGLNAVELHGNLSQEQRVYSFNFFNKNISILLATDIAARGLDFPKVDLVINYSLPVESTQYIHRVGRTARAGAVGVCVTLANEDEYRLMKQMIKKSKETLYSRKMDFSKVKNCIPLIRDFEYRYKLILKKERLEKELCTAEMEATRAQNMLMHENEIYSRPKREWIVSKEQRFQTAEASKKKNKLY